VESDELLFPNRELDSVPVFPLDEVLPDLTTEQERRELSQV
jgi:hypothetical protein